MIKKPFLKKRTIQISIEEPGASELVELLEKYDASLIEHSDWKKNKVHVALTGTQKANMPRYKKVKGFSLGIREKKNKYMSPRQSCAVTTK